MSFRRQGTAAAALAVVALAAPPARADRLEAAERAATSLEGQLAELELALARPVETSAAAAARHAADGEAQYRLGDWLHASLLLTAAVDAPELQGAPERVRALPFLADALRRQGDFGAAGARYAAYLAIPGAPERAQALAGALECAVRERRMEEVARLATEAEQAFGGALPPETAYLAAKAFWYRRDLSPADRAARGVEALASVKAPFDLEARYLQGALLVDASRLDDALERFRSCAAAVPGDARQIEARDQCRLAVGRVLGAQGKWDEAVAAYLSIPAESRAIDEALYEAAWMQVKARRFGLALHTTSAVSDLAPESALAPEANILEGHLLLKLGKYAAATEAYNRVINTYAPVRDELDAVLTMHEDPIRYFNELLGRQGQSFDVAAVLPPAAVRWAAAEPGVPQALALVQDLEAARREVRDADALTERIDVAVARSGGVDAFASLSEAWAGAEAARNESAWLEAEAADRAVEVAGGALAPGPRGDLAQARAARDALARRFASLPRSLEDVRDRKERLQDRSARAERLAYQSGLAVDGLKRAIAGTELWLEEHRAEITTDAGGRQEMTEELRKHRAVVAGYEEELRTLRDELAQARDGAVSVAALEQEARLREEVRALAARELELAGTARAGLAPAGEAELRRVDALVARAAAARERAARVEEKVRASAGQRALQLKQAVEEERVALVAEAKALDDIQSDGRELLGRLAFRSFSAVREQFYRLVLKADVGIVDIAWARKRERVEKIQQLSMQKSAELQQLDDDFRPLLREFE